MTSGDGSQSGPTAFATMFRSLLEGAGKVLGVAVASWIVWDNVRRACRETRLYAPFNGAAWAAIADPSARATASTEAVILRVYSPGGPGYETLVAELRTTRLLAEHQAQMREVFASLNDGRAYVAICGTLPLIEGVLTRANGSWRRIDTYQLDERLNSMEEGDVSHPGFDGGLVARMSCLVKGDALFDGCTEEVSGGVARARDPARVRVGSADQARC